MLDPTEHVQAPINSVTFSCRFFAIDYLTAHHLFSNHSKLKPSARDPFCTVSLSCSKVSNEVVQPVIINFSHRMASEISASLVTHTFMSVLFCFSFSEHRVMWLGEYCRWACVGCIYSFCSLLRSCCTCSQCTLFTSARIVTYKSEIKPFMPAHQSNSCKYTRELSIWVRLSTSRKCGHSLFTSTYTLQSVRRR